MDISLFDFNLPEESIALRPCSPRDHAKLLHVKDGLFTDHQVFDLPSHLREGDVLVVNDTRVIHAALTGIRPARPVGGGGDVKLDVNLLERTAPNQWQAFVRPAKRVRAGDEISFGEGLSAVAIADPHEGLVMLKFSQSAHDLDVAIAKTGAAPLPPYIARKRAADEADKSDYQTVYADESGSVAAPTAGLHFTPELLSQLAAKNISFEKLTLHVGAGTFLPVKTDNTDDHIMHSEWRIISEDLAVRINKAKAEGRRIIAVGTTSLRAIESAAENGQLKATTGETDIFIKPGYKFQIIDGLMTNFHLPKSTLFMLVCALVGRETMVSAYEYAVANDYRFYSYGDSSLIWKDTR
ncbi:MAG: tRNA preQ1(34) S-adenosylmethionine ribosyltransferase-isomerase QueA [Maricaulaceae bacterium]